MSGWDPDPAELRRIREGLRDVVKETPVFSFGALSRRCGGEVSLKAESLQRTGSFKLRGTSAKLRADPDAAARGVVTGSAGNHGQALAYAARARGIPCTIFMPVEAAVSKVEAVAAFGAEVRGEGTTVDECIAAARRLAEEQGLLFVHPFDDLDVVKGQAGVGLEILAQVPEVARVVVPVGGGGLISGVAGAIKAERPEVEIVGVQAAGCASLRTSLAEGHPEAVAVPSTIADGIAVKRPGELTFALMERWLDDLAEVDDDAIAEAMVFLVERAKLVTEGAGAVAVAALTTGAVAPAQAGTTVAILSGGNVDANVLAAAINRAQTGAGRRVRFFTRISDRPGVLAGLLGQVAAAGGNLLDVTHVRDGVSLHVDETGVELLVECRSVEAGRRLLEEMRAAGYPVEELIREEPR
ncbi:MAG: threonine ammonia-lyase [Actinobacteria bacterium]|nr:threonine ammonia-lyase [Actinomycetota bacterium]